MTITKETNNHYYSIVMIQYFIITYYWVMTI